MDDSLLMMSLPLLTESKREPEGASGINRRIALPGRSDYAFGGEQFIPVKASRTG